MRTVASIYLDLTNYPTYGDLAAAKIDYAALALLIIYDATASGSSTSTGTAVPGQVMSISASSSPRTVVTYGELGQTWDTYSELFSNFANYRNLAYMSVGSDGVCAIRVVHPASASGSSSSNGSTTARMTLTAAASGTSTSVGTASAIMVSRVQGAADSNSDGSAVIRQHSSLSASATSSSSGSINATMIEAIWYLSADGTAITDGAGNLVATIRESGTGESTSTGSGTPSWVVGISGSTVIITSGQESIRLRISGNFMFATAISSGSIEERHLVSANGWGIPI